jgi:Na+/H+ antiporter NhaC
MGWVSLLPPLVAIVAALAFRQVLLSLALGVWIGASLMAGYDPWQGLLRMLDHYFVGAVADGGHASILAFTLLLGGMVGVIGRSGGSAALAGGVTRWATTRRRGQISTWLLGLVIFFDDYANALLVGTSVRPVTDRLRISREKLAFLVDATAAPVASLAVVSSWVGVEMGYIADQYTLIGLDGEPFVVLLQTLPHRYYPLLMLVFVGLVAWTGRDFGAMARAEARAFQSGQLLREGARPASDLDEPASRAGGSGSVANALVPIAVIVCTAVAGLVVTGRQGALAEGLEPTLRNTFSHASSVQALLWGSGLGCMAAVAVALVGRGRLTFGQAVEGVVGGMRAMLQACLILVLAWSLGAVCHDVGTADHVVSLVGDSIPAAALPAAVFVTAAVVSFATGTSWGTMAILFPLVVPLAYAVGGGEGTVLLSAMGSILAGAVFGDHCSPISDTTVLSSVASGCDHVDHVRTQLPYALTVGAVAVLFGELPVAAGIYPSWVGLLLGACVLFAVLRWRGKALAPAD